MSGKLLSMIMFFTLIGCNVAQANVSGIEQAYYEKASRMRRATTTGIDKEGYLISISTEHGKPEWKIDRIAPGLIIEVLETVRYTALLKPKPDTEDVNEYIERLVGQQDALLAKYQGMLIEKKESVGDVELA